MPDLRLKHPYPAPGPAPFPDHMVRLYAPGDIMLARPVHSEGPARPAPIPAGDRWARLQDQALTWAGKSQTSQWKF